MPNTSTSGVLVVEKEIEEVSAEDGELDCGEAAEWGLFVGVGIFIMMIIMVMTIFMITTIIIILIIIGKLPWEFILFIDATMGPCGIDMKCLI